MTSAIPVHVGLVDRTGDIDPAYLATVAGALNEQVQADFAPVWHVRASVGVYHPKDVEASHMWRVEMVAHLDEPGALGYHTNLASGQPISLVQYDPLQWPGIASHEVLEMLADPFGTRMHQARLPVGLEAQHRDFGLRHPSSRVSYLLEVCDPCEATSYSVGGVDLSDFLHPAWYRTNADPLASASHAGGVVQPRQVAPGGYVSFAVGDEWFQVFAERNGQLEVQALGRFDANDHATLRAWTDECSRNHRARAEH
jgi:hypothetical protein